MSQNDLLTKFRELLKNKKSDELTATKSTPLFEDDEEDEEDVNILETQPRNSRLILRRHEKSVEKEIVKGAVNNQTSNQGNSKPRTSVFDLIKRFEKKDQEVKIEEIIDNKTNTGIGNYNENTIFKDEENFETVDYPSNQRNSTNQHLVLHSLKKTKQDENKASVNNITPVTSDKTPNDVPKKLVQDLVRMNERRLSTGNRKVPKQRNTVTQKFKNNMAEIKSILESMKNGENDAELLNENSEKLKKLGIDSSDIKMVSELIQYFEANVKLAQEKSKPKQRNTVSNIGKLRSINLDIDPIEEKEEEHSLGESMRKSETYRKSINSLIKSEILEKNNESEDSFHGIEDNLLLEDVKFAEEEDIERFEEDRNKSSECLEISYHPKKNTFENLSMSPIYNTLSIPSIRKQKQKAPLERTNEVFLFFESEESKKEKLFQVGIKMQKQNQLLIKANRSRKDTNFSIFNVHSVFYEASNKKLAFDISSSNNLEITPHSKTDTNTKISLAEQSNTFDNKSNIKNKIIEDYYTTTNNTNKYHKNIINSLDSISILQYNLNSFDPVFFDILCTNCYECVKFAEIDLHSDKCVIQSDDNFKNLVDENEDYNGRIYKLYESLRSRVQEVYSTNDDRLIAVYDELSKLTYDILLNNNSIEELDLSIHQLNDLLNNKLAKIKTKFNFSLLILGQRVSQLVFIKLQDMEKILMVVGTEDEGFITDNDRVDINKYFSSDIEEYDFENIKQIEMLRKELVDLEKQTIETKQEIEQWRQESKQLENMMKKPNQNAEGLSEIMSDVQSRRDESFDGLTMVTGQTSEYDMTDVADMKDFTEILDVNNEEDLKKYFLSIGLSLKFKYGDRVKGNTSIGDLFEKAKMHKIPINDWYNFIYAELNIN